ncbi:MAG: DUF58 domain-containing protein [Phycisphaerae bacterium]|nr:DUF58 domain-containing protein [Phycisphaerae bacterium]
MSRATELVSPHDLRRIADLQLLARMIVEGFCAGLHKSPHKGLSVEFKQHRAYVRGDDLRYLDWRIFGKSDRYFIKEYEAETNLRATLIVDASGSMAYGGESAAETGDTVGLSKYDYAIRLAACLTYLLLAQQDAVGLMLFDTTVRKYVPPRSTPRHMQVVIDALSAQQPGGETSLADVFRRISAKLHRRGLLIVLSDCFDEVNAFLRAIAQLRHAGHEVIVLQLWHRDELEFPFTRWTRFECLETAGRNHMVDPATLRAAYVEKLKEYQDTLTRGCRQHAIDLLPIVTDRPYAEALAEYLAFRERKG